MGFVVHSLHSLLIDKLWAVFFFLIDLRYSEPTATHVESQFETDIYVKFKFKTVLQNNHERITSDKVAFMLATKVMSTNVNRKHCFN